MKSINFIDPVPPQKQKALLTWLYTTAIITFIFIFILFYIHIKHVRISHTLAQDLKDLRQQTAEYDATKKRQQSLEASKKVLEERLHKLRSVHEESQAPYSLLLMLAMLTPTDICLSSCNVQPGKIAHLEGMARHAKAVTKFIEALHNCQLFKEVRLASLTTSEAEDSLMHFIIEGVWEGDTIAPHEQLQQPVQEQISF